MRWNHRLASIAMLLTGPLLVLPEMALAQTESSPIVSEEPGSDALRLRLEMEIDRVSAHRERLEEGLRALDAGGTPAQVRAIIAPEDEGPPDFDLAGPGPRGEGAKAREFREEDLETMLTVIRETNPQMHTRITQALERNPERARQFLRRAWPRVAEMVELREENPELYRLRVRMMRTNIEIMKKAGLYARASREGADETELALIRDELSALVDQQLDARLKEQQDALERSRERLSRIELEIEAMTNDRDHVIETRVDEIIERALSRGDERGGSGSGALAKAGRSAAGRSAAGAESRRSVRFSRDRLSSRI